jgi:basic amino acid/polyamine antiporter, APA family
MAKKIRLKKELGLFEVFTISTGAMFSSGFFLLPGLASQYTGPSVFLAYLVSGILIMPAMFSMAEIATALPRSGGAYFFLDRSLGPLMGTIGGLGTYFALMFKTAFAIIGIGAYAAIFWEVPVKTIAVMATFFFMSLNLIGVRKTSGLQNFFVVFLLIVLGTFILDGFYNIFLTDRIDIPGVNEHFDPFFTHGFEGVIFTAGFVFVSYLGLTQIASVAEEIKNPERNIPLGMLLSLVVTGIVYVLGVFVMVSVIDPAEFSNDLAPAASAVKKLFRWMPGNLGAWLMTGAAMAAFASTGNAGLFSSSRYPFAMGRDRLFPGGFSKVGKKGTPVSAILLTTGIILLFILLLSERGIAKLASTFQLFIFMLINFSVIVFRKSNIESYDPGYRSPLYPYMQVAGIVISLVLIAYMGWSAILFTAFIILIGYLWYT